MEWMRHAEPRRRPRPRRRRPGIHEAIAALAVIGIVANVAAHRARAAGERELAAQVLADLHAIEAAARAYRSVHGTWPMEMPRGVAPGGLEPMSGVPLVWRRADLGLTYDWENWVLADGSPRHPGTGVACGISVVVDPGREALLDRLAGFGGVTFIRPRRDRVTLVLELLSVPD